MSISRVSHSMDSPGLGLLVLTHARLAQLKRTSLQPLHGRSSIRPDARSTWDWKPMTAEANFSRQPRSVALARRFTEEVLCGVPAPIAIEIVLMVSELATNAVVHAATAFRLNIERTDKLVRVEVVDGGGGHAFLRSPTDSDVRGRGLQLVDTLSDQWGTTEDGDDGKTVWFVRSLAQTGSGRRDQQGVDSQRLITMASRNRSRARLRPQSSAAARRRRGRLGHAARVPLRRDAPPPRPPAP